MVRGLRPLAAAVVTVSFALAAGFSIWLLTVVVDGADGDTRLLTSYSPWLLLAFPAYWAAAWLVSFFSD